jgi:hypothetical protein
MQLMALGLDHLVCLYVCLSGTDLKTGYGTCTLFIYCGADSIRERGDLVFGMADFGRLSGCTVPSWPMLFNISKNLAMVLSTSQVLAPVAMVGYFLSLSLSRARRVLCGIWT